MLHWALREEHHPARTYARSGGSSGLCTFVSGVLCPDVVEHALEPFGGELPDFSDPIWQPLHEGADLPGMITPEIAETREIAFSWGVNTQGSVCTDSGAVACAKEGLWGVDYTGRRFRTLWQRAEPPFAPTGYFVQDESGDCVHTAGASSKTFRCSLCFLADGRQGMEGSCPECLSYTDPTISEGGEAEACHLEAPWYQDPIAASDPEPPPGPWLEDLDLPGFRSKVRISTVDSVITGQRLEPCIDETLCLAGALADRVELFVRVVGPKPNGKLWPTLVKFSTSRVEVWIEQLSGGEIRYYDLPAVTPGGQILTLDGLADTRGFDP